MKHALIIILLLISAGQTCAQHRTFTLSVFYAINEVESESNFKRIDSVLLTLNTGTTEVSVYGYADYLHSYQYNLNLSKRRAEAVKKYILQNSKTISVIACEGLGEKNSTAKNDKTGEFLQRRVDLVISQRNPVKKIGTRDNIIQEENPRVSEKIIEPKINSGRKNLEDLEKGETLTIQGLNFIPGKHILVRDAIPVLEELLETLKERPELKIEIQGHVCCVEPAEPDGIDMDTGKRNLSENRAKTVYNYLVRNGISRDRLTYKGYGHSYPKIQIERSPEDEQVNRRVEIKILEK